MNYVILMAGVSALAIGNSLFFGLYLLFSKNGKYPNTLLGLLLFALALRISKSVIIIAFPQSSEVFPAIGLIGMAAIGPFTYLYTKSLFGIGYRTSVIYHFIPSFLIGASVAFVEEHVIYRYYQLVVSQILVYLILSAVYVKNNQGDPGTNKLKMEWCIRLLAGVMAIWSAFFYQLISDSFLSYIIATAIAAIVLYILSFWSMQRRKIFNFNILKDTVNYQLKEIAFNIDQLFKEEKLYREDGITLNTVAEKLKLQPYLISKAINEVFHQTFPEFLSSHRVEEAKKRLAGDTNQSLSIESIAYDSGFSTLSSFYSSFKKNAKMTPAEYRKKSSI